jgi:hypothetical protein
MTDDLKLPDPASLGIANSRREILAERLLDDEAASLRQAKAGHGTHGGLERRGR